MGKLAYISKRSFERSNHLLPVTCFSSADTSRGVDSINSETLNISNSGVCIVTERDSVPGEILRLNVHLEDSKITLPTFGEVRWANSNHGIYVLGIEFLL